MKKIAIYLLIASASVTMGAQVRVMTCEECISVALSNNLSMQAEQKNVERARLLTGTAYDIPNMEVELSQDALSGGSMENGIRFSQEFDFPTVYIAKRKALKADYLVAQGSYMEKKNQFVGDVMSAYYSLTYSKEKVKVLEEQTALYAEFVKVAVARYNAGEVSQLESINAQRMLAKGNKALMDARLELEANRIELANLVRTDVMIEPSESGLSVLDLPELSEPDDFMAGTTFRGRLQELEVQRSERLLSVAKQEFMPSLFVAATHQLVIEGFNPYDVDRSKFDKGNFMGFQVGVTVPLFFGAKRAHLLAAKRDVEIAKLMNREEINLINKEYSEAVNEFAAARKSLDYYEQTGVGMANEIIRLAKISYELGDIDYIEYIQNMETASDLKIEYLESIERYNQSVIRIEMIQGIL